MPGEAWSFPSHSYLHFISQPCQVEADSKSYMKGTQFFHKRVEPITCLPFLLLPSLKDRKLLHSNFHVLFLWNFQFLLFTSICSPRHKVYQNLTKNYINLQRCFFSIHREVKSFCCEPHIQWWKFHFKHPLYKYVCDPHAASFEARPWEEQENCWTVA